VSTDKVTDRKFAVEITFVRGRTSRLQKLMLRYWVVLSDDVFSRVLTGIILLVKVGYVG
jgi:hypothetical protein